MANDSSLQGGAVVSAFDLESQTGVTHLLASVRASEISPEQKNELRDLIFLYTNGGRDQSVRITLEQKLQAHNVVSLAAPAKSAPVSAQPAHPIGTSRPAPSFPVAASQSAPTEAQTTSPEPVTISAPTPTPEPAAAPEPAVPVATSKPVDPQAPAPAPEPAVAPIAAPLQTPPLASTTLPTTPAPVSEPAPASTPAPVAVPQSELTPVAVPAPTPTPAPAPLPTSPAPAPVPAPVPSTPTPTPAPEPAATPVQAQVPGYDPNQTLQRIREIKSLVNDKVGNPVNLVDIDNEVGREYMGALLDAMKKLNNGTSALSAMKRLEEAYIKVEKTLAEHDEKQALAPEIPQEEPKEEQPPTPIPAEETPAEPAPVEEKIVPPPPPTVKEELAPMPAPSEPTPPPAPPAPPEPQKQPGESKDTSPKEPKTPIAPRKPFEVPVVPRVDVEEIPTPKIDESDKSEGPANLPVREPISGTPVPLPPPVKESASEKPETATNESEEEIPTAWGPETDSVPISGLDKVASESDNKVTSLADSKTKLRTPSDLQEASAIETSSVEGDPLFTKEVDDGLQQLLSEWSIFKKSGLFGTGPKGREHPLFLKIASLQIPLLLAGRFEGATQEVKQSITDYMNGWRYEQGIIYVQGETFEHYLRRVIRHILDLQKRKVVR